MKRNRPIQHRQRPLSTLHCPLSAVLSCNQINHLPQHSSTSVFGIPSPASNSINILSNDGQQHQRSAATTSNVRPSDGSSSSSNNNNNNDNNCDDGNDFNNITQQHTPNVTKDSQIFVKCVMTSSTFQGQFADVPIVMQHANNPKSAWLDRTWLWSMGMTS